MKHKKESSQNNDAFFLDRIKKGIIVVDSLGNIINPKTGECLPCDARCPSITIKGQKIETNRLVWLGVFGPIPNGFKITAVNKNVHDRDPFNMKLDYI